MKVLTQRPLVHDGRDAAEEFVAHVCERGGGAAHEGVHTHVALHVLPPLLRLCPVAMETGQLAELRDQHQLKTTEESEERFTCRWNVQVTANSEREGVAVR